MTPTPSPAETPDFCPGCELPKAHVDTCGSPNCYWKANIAGRETKAWHVERARAEADYSIGAGVPEHLEGVIAADVIAKLRVEAQGEADADRLFTDARFGKNYCSRTPEQTLRWKAADLIEQQALLLSERESEIERLKGEALNWAKVEELAIEAQVAAEARLQQALEGLEKAGERLSVEAQSAGTILAVQVLRRKMGDIRADLFTTLAAIQGDSHERV